MHLLMLGVKAGLYLLMAVSVAAAIAVVTLPNILHAALCFVITLLGVAGIYLALHAEFIAVVQILLYVGAVMTLVIFAIMMTQHITDKSIAQKNQLGLPAFAAAMVFFAALSQLIFQTKWPVKPETVAARIGVFEIGQSLMGKYVFPFEVISVLLIAALVGAIVIARKESE